MGRNSATTRAPEESVPSTAMSMHNPPPQWMTGHPNAPPFEPHICGTARPPSTHTTCRNRRAPSITVVELGGKYLTTRTVHAAHSAPARVRMVSQLMP